MLPNLRVAPRSNVRVQTSELEAVLPSGCQRLIQVFMPDAETGRRPADVCPVVVPRTKTGIDPNRQLMAGKQCPKCVDLCNRAGIELDSPGHQFLQIVRHLLRCELNSFRRNTGAERALDLIAAAGINMQTGIGQHLDHCACWTSFRRITGRQAESIGKAKYQTGLMLQRPLIIYENRCPKLPMDGTDFIFSKKRDRLHARALLYHALSVLHVRLQGQQYCSDKITVSFDVFCREKPKSKCLVHSH